MEALEFIEAGAPADIMLLDIRMPVKSGTDVMRECARALPTYPVVRGCSCIFVMLSCERDAVMASRAAPSCTAWSQPVFPLPMFLSNIHCDLGSLSLPGCDDGACRHGGQG